MIRSDPSQLDGRLGCAPLLDAGNAARPGEPADHVFLDRGAEILVLPGVEFDALLAQHLAQHGGAVEMPHGQAVGLRRLVEVIHHDDAARPGHVIHDDGRVAGDVLAHVTADDASVGVEAAPRGKPDDETYRLALVVVGLSLGGAARGRERNRERQRIANPVGHETLLLVIISRDG
jgi:hypothetical protein